MKLFSTLAFAVASLGVALATSNEAAATTNGEGLTAQLTGFLNNARSLFSHDLPLPKDWAVWRATSEVDGEDDTASSDNWFGSSPINRPGNGRPPRPNRPNRPNNGNGNGPQRAMQADDDTASSDNWFGSSPINRPGNGRPPRPNRPNRPNNGNGNGPQRALQWDDGTDGGYEPAPEPTVPPTVRPTGVYGSFPYYPPEPVYEPYDEEPVEEEEEDSYSDTDHDKMAAVPGLAPPAADKGYKPKSSLVRALEDLQFKKAREQPTFSLRGSNKA